MTSALHRFTPRVLDGPSYLLESFVSAQYEHTVVLTVEASSDDVTSTFEGIVRGIVEPLSASSCKVRFSADTPALLLTQVAAIAHLGPFTVDQATPETAALITAAGERLTDAFAGSGHDQADA